MSFVDYTIDGVKHYTDVGGNVGCIPGSISTALNGLYLKMKDDCGVINETGDGRHRPRLGSDADGDGLRGAGGPLGRRHEVEPFGLLRAQPQIEKAQSHLNSPRTRRRSGCAASSRPR